MGTMKVLIVHGSTRGGTAGLADMIGAAFRDRGWTAEVRDARSVEPIGDAEVVIVGGALYLGRWHREARHFVRRHRAALMTVPVWLFSSGPLDDSARSGSLAPVPQVHALARQLEARGHMTFGGRLEPDAKGFVAGRIAKKQAGDWRSREQVDEWVHQIIHDLVPAPVVLPEQRTISLPESLVEPQETNYAAHARRSGRRPPVSTIRD